MTVFREGGRLVAVIPDRMSPRQEEDLLPALVTRFLQREAKRAVPAQPDELTERAVQLFDRYLAGRVDGDLPPVQVRWVGNQQKRWGSCTPSAGTIRLSERLKGMPAWVGDYVLLHELAHLFEARHSSRFWELLDAYPHHQRARGYLEGYQAASGLEISEAD